ncbi:MAG: ABC transporter ATP-binding protein [Lachnospiraceae bacterium]|nr:ABC transporter ATP-binding protein [Lachnospiraceae bacterium]
MEKNSILKLTDVTKRFGGLLAVDSLNIDVKEHSIHSLIGPNGAGKTTTVNLITGVLPVTSGTVEFDGKNVTGKKTYEIARLGIGRTFQNIKVFQTMTLLENIMVGGNQLTKMGIVRTILDFKGSAREEKMLKEKAEGLLDKLGMYHLRNEYMKNLAYGRQKISEIARAMMTDPKLILLDEPAAGLNPSERAELVKVIQKSYEEGFAFFLIEHNMDVVMNLSDDITVLSFGKKIAAGTPAEIRDNDEVITAYLGSAFVKNKEQEGAE